MASLQHEIRRRGYAIRTEKSYLYWVRRFILFHHKQHPTELSDEDVKNVSVLFGECAASFTKHTKGCPQCISLSLQPVFKPTAR
ncbi:phage integrase N-terminal SAM-like domain-containing protein [Salinivibrio sp. AR640]|uniref:phage integrase N-terminal SAM-like domain-containing protein n=1 Tax=Salinivibrio sp. AR640 TaxID=1909437 RepID=UPI003FD1DD3A